VFAGLALLLGMMEIYDKTVEILPRFAHGYGALQTPWTHLATALRQQRSRARQRLFGACFSLTSPGTYPIISPSRVRCFS
jgi:hypothetical protein